MKKINKLLMYLLVAPALLTSCQKNEISEPNDPMVSEVTAKVRDLATILENGDAYKHPDYFVDPSVYLPLQKASNVYKDRKSTMKITDVFYDPSSKDSEGKMIFNANWSTEFYGQSNFVCNGKLKIPMYSEGNDGDVNTPDGNYGDIKTWKAGKIVQESN